MNEEDRAAL